MSEIAKIDAESVVINDVKGGYEIVIKRPEEEPIIGFQKPEDPLYEQLVAEGYINP